MLISFTVNFKRKKNSGNSPLQQGIIALRFMGSNSSIMPRARLLTTSWVMGLNCRNPLGPNAEEGLQPLQSVLRARRGREKWEHAANWKVLYVLEQDFAPQSLWSSRRPAEVYGKSPISYNSLAPAVLGLLGCCLTMCYVGVFLSLLFKSDIEI